MWGIWSEKCRLEKRSSARATVREDLVAMHQTCPNDVSALGTYFFLASAGLGRPELVLNGDAGAAGFFSCLGFFASRLLRT